MDQSTHNKIVSFIWGIADDVLRDLFRRGKYPDVILPMCVLRRLDAVLEPTKRAVLESREMLDAAGITEQHAALCDAARQAFYNTSKFPLRDADLTVIGDGVCQGCRILCLSVLAPITTWHQFDL
jgi:type I restriction enzyme M protein